VDKINPDIIKDPTMPRDASARCPRCEERDPFGTEERHGVVFCLPPVASMGDKISLIFVCCNPECLHKWQG
jgi:hypothetical protein